MRKEWTMSLLLSIVMFFVGCARNGPLAPSTTPIVRWNEIAPGCTPRGPLTEPSGVRVGGQDGDTLRYLYRRADDSVIVVFNRVGDHWALCFWDTSDN